MMNLNNNSASNQLAAAKHGAGSKEPQYSHCLAQISWPEAGRARFKVGSPWFLCLWSALSRSGQGGGGTGSASFSVGSVSSRSCI